jgi:antimicrobial peptide system SdpA family protein
LLVGFWILVGGTVFISTVPLNPLTGAMQKKELFVFLPQGWAFFTRNPKEDKIYAFKKEGGKWVSLTHPNSTYFLGAGRDMRLQGFEIDVLLSQIDLKSLTECDSLEGCDFKSATVTNYLKRPELCGELLIAFIEPVPWAWAYHGKNVKMPVKGIICNVNCNAANN